MHITQRTFLVNRADKELKNYLVHFENMLIGQKQPKSKRHLAIKRP